MDSRAQGRRRFPVWPSVVPVLVAISASPPARIRCGSSWAATDSLRAVAVLDVLIVAISTLNYWFVRSGRTQLWAASALGFDAIAAGCEMPESRRGISGRWEMGYRNRAIID